MVQILYVIYDNTDEYIQKYFSLFYSDEKLDKIFDVLLL